MSALNEIPQFCRWHWRGCRVSKGLWQCCWPGDLLLQVLSPSVRHRESNSALEAGGGNRKSALSLKFLSVPTVLLALQGSRLSNHLLHCCWPNDGPMAPAGLGISTLQGRQEAGTLPCDVVQPELVALLDQSHRVPEQPERHEFVRRAIRPAA